MAEWHLRDLRNSLEHRGWQLVAEEEGDDLRVSGTWLMSREVEIRIDFDGFDERGCFPIERSYACSVRGSGLCLYFRRYGADSAAHARWKRELSAFVNSLDGLSNS